MQEKLENYHLIFGFSFQINMSIRLKKFKVAVRKVIQRKKSENLKNGNHHDQA